uniref:VP2 n=1 Tax=Guangdong greater green snake calicivirus TaxID=2116169 RepID=A0A2P1GMK6_9CALI|nr:VP2 [Guangdong greater green snake calicivirus]
MMEAALAIAGGNALSGLLQGIFGIGSTAMQAKASKEVAAITAQATRYNADVISRTQLLSPFSHAKAQQDMFWSNLDRQRQLYEQAGLQTNQAIYKVAGGMELALVGSNKLIAGRDTVNTYNHRTYRH